MARFRDNAMLQTRDGRLFLAAQSLDSVAIGVAQVALPWLVLDATGSEAQAGLVFMLGPGAVRRVRAAGRPDRRPVPPPDGDLDGARVPGLSWP